MTDPHTTLFGNPQCQICMARHPIGHDCVAENRRRMEQMSETIKNIRPHVPRNLLETYDGEVWSGGPRIEMGKPYVYHRYTLCFQGIDTINVTHFTRTGILVQGLELWYRTDSIKLPLAILTNFLSDYGFRP